MWPFSCLKREDGRKHAFSILLSACSFRPAFRECHSPQALRNTSPGAVTWWQHGPHLWTILPPPCLLLPLRHIFLCSSQGAKGSFALKTLSFEDQEDLAAGRSCSVSGTTLILLLRRLRRILWRLHLTARVLVSPLCQSP